MQARLFWNRVSTRNLPKIRNLRFRSLTDTPWNTSGKILQPQIRNEQGHVEGSRACKHGFHAGSPRSFSCSVFLAPGFQALTSEKVINEYCCRNNCSANTKGASQLVLEMPETRTKTTQKRVGNRLRITGTEPGYYGYRRNKTK